MRQVMWVMGRKAIGPHESNEDRPPDSVAIYIGKTERPFLWLVVAEQDENANQSLAELRTGAKIGFRSYEPLFLRSWHVVV